MDRQIVDPGLNITIQRGDLHWRPALRNCCNINSWVPLCGVPYVFVGRPTSREHVSWLMSDIVLTVFNVALSI